MFASPAPPVTTASAASPSSPSSATGLSPTAVAYSERARSSRSGRHDSQATSPSSNSHAPSSHRRSSQLESSAPLAEPARPSPHRARRASSRRSKAPHADLVAADHIRAAAGLDESSDFAESLLQSLGLAGQTAETAAARAMSRGRAATAGNSNYAPYGYMPPLASAQSNTTPEAAGSVAAIAPSTSAPTPSTVIPQVSKSQQPTIRFVCHQDPRGARPSLTFGTLARTLPNNDSRIRVGRYSERDAAPDVPPNTPSDAPIGFKSKVVSRRHCEFWCTNSQWYIRDVKSSSGTFLNHIRLSQPGCESRPWPVNDGDIVQLGIDFKGGEEMIFRCVKIRVECNRGWQKSLNKFNKSTHKHLRSLAHKASPIGAERLKEGDTASMHSTECSICLMSIAPCQSLFVAPCSHTWHYRCIRPVINGPSWPQFQCPNCRAYADLEADIDEPSEYELWEDEELIQQQSLEAQAQTSPGNDRENAAEGDNTIVDKDLSSARGVQDSEIQLDDASAVASPVRSAGLPNRPQPLRDESALQTDLYSSDSSSYSADEPNITPEEPDNSDLTMRPPLSAMVTSVNEDQIQLRSPEGLVAHEGPTTPRNEAGPFVLDGDAARASMTGGGNAL